MDSISLETLKSLDKLQYADAYVKVNSFGEGRDAACEHFKSMFDDEEEWDDDMVHIRGPKTFNNLETGIVTVVYEAFLDSGSVDYFFFSFEHEM